MVNLLQTKAHHKAEVNASKSLRVLVSENKNRNVKKVSDYYDHLNFWISIMIDNYGEIYKGTKG